MARKRGAGEGTIYKRTKKLKDGTERVYWEGSLSLGFDASGKRKRLRFTGKTRREVAEKLAKAVADHQAGTLAEPTKETVGQFLQRWLRDSVKHSVAPRTFESYAGNVQRHIIPEIGGLGLRKLTPAHVQALYRRKLDEGLSPRTVQYLHAILHRALEQAVKWGLIPRNVCDAVDRPKATTKTMQVLDLQQARRFLDAAKEDRLYALYVLAVHTGMRQGELLGLTWEDIDFEAGTVAVRRQLQWDRRQKRFMLRQATKGGRSRTLRLTPAALNALRKHKARQAQEKLALGEAWQNAWNLVFTTQIGTPIHEGNLRNRSFEPLLQKAGLPRIRFHDLRHTAATLAIQAGVPIKQVQAMLGHASIMLTLDTYAHVTTDMQEDAAARMEAILTAAE